MATTSSVLIKKGNRFLARGDFALIVECLFRDKYFKWMRIRDMIYYRRDLRLILIKYEGVHCSTKIIVYIYICSFLLSIANVMYYVKKL